MFNFQSFIAPHEHFRFYNCIFRAWCQTVVDISPEIASIIMRPCTDRHNKFSGCSIWRHYKPSHSMSEWFLLVFNWQKENLNKRMTGRTTQQTEYTGLSGRFMIVFVFWTKGVGVTDTGRTLISGWYSTKECKFSISL